MIVCSYILINIIYYSIVFKIELEITKTQAETKHNETVLNKTFELEEVCMASSTQHAMSRKQGDVEAASKLRQSAEIKKSDKPRVMPTMTTTKLIGASAATPLQQTGSNVMAARRPTLPVGVSSSSSNSLPLAINKVKKLVVNNENSASKSTLGVASRNSVVAELLGAKSDIATPNSALKSRKTILKAPIKSNKTAESKGNFSLNSC